MPNGADPLTSWGADADDVLTADGLGKVIWAPGGSGGSILPTAFVTLGAAVAGTIPGDGVTEENALWASSSGYTNDKPAATGYQTPQGGAYIDTGGDWIGDNFEYDPAGFDAGYWGSGLVPLKIRHDRPGIYLAHISFNINFGFDTPTFPFDAWFSTIIQPTSGGGIGDGALSFKQGGWTPRMTIETITGGEHQEWPHFDSIVIHRGVVDNENSRGLGFRAMQDSGLDKPMSAQMAIVRLNADPA